MIHNLTGKTVVLGSNSPRRRELLGMLIDDFVIATTKDIDESYPDTLKAEDVPAYLSQVKARAYIDDIGDGAILVTADTVVILDGNILGKPRDEEQAVDMLKQLSGRTHTVVTGVTVADSKHSETFTSVTEVDFAKLDDDEITHYVDNYRPLDKAGAYGIQEWIGAIGISGIRGSFYNVMGLPIHQLYKRLKNWDTNPADKA